MMNTKYRKLKKVKRGLGALCVAGTVTLMTAPAQAQLGNLGDDVGNAVNNAVNEAADDVRASVDGRVQSALGTQQQQRTNNPIQDLNANVQGNLQSNVQSNRPGNAQLRSNTTGQAWYRDGQGRHYYQNQQGQRIYGQPHTQYQQSNQQHYDARANLGADFQANSQGIGISSITQGGLAADAGLQNGDVVVKIDGQAVQDANALNQRLGSLQANQQAELTVMRNGEEQTVTFGDSARTRAETSYRANDQNSTQTRSSFESDYNIRLDTLQRDYDQLRRDFDTLKADYDSRNSASVQSNEAELQGEANLNADATLETERQDNSNN